MSTLLNVSLGLGALAAGLVLFTRHTNRRVQAAVPPKGYFVDVPGGTLHVWEQGAGPALLLLHGLGGHIGHYAYGIAERLATDFRVVMVDRPGSGYSTRLGTTSADLSTQATVLAGLIARLELGRPLVVGHSLGGAVALTLALEHPECVAGLALVSPLTYLPATTPAAFKALIIKPRWLRKLFAWTLAIPGSFLNRQQVMDQVFGPEAVPAGYATRASGLLNLRPSHFMATAADLEALDAHLPAISTRYSTLQVPVWVLYGADDRILNGQDNGQALVSQVPGATLQLVPGGHMLPLTQPELTANFIRRAAQ